MISEISIEKSQIHEQSQFNFVRQMNNINSIQLSSGLNLIFGSNGCGKSTLLKMMACASWSDMAGFPCLTQKTMLAKTRKEGALDHQGIRVKHDGQVLYADPSRYIHPSPHPLSQGEDAFQAMYLPYTLMRQAANPEKYKDVQSLVDEEIVRRSTRQTSKHIEQITAKVRSKIISDGFVCAEKFPSPRNSFEEVGVVCGKAEAIKKTNKLKIAMDDFKPSIPAGKPTILLDEPDSSLSLISQSKFWGLVCNKKVLDNFQIVIISKSMIALDIACNLEGVNSIELTPNFRSLASDFVRNFRDSIASN